MPLEDESAESPRNTHREVRLRGGCLEIDRGVMVTDTELRSLSPRELQLAHYLLDRPGEAVSRDELAAGIWGGAEAVDGRTVDQAMKRLRQKVERDPGDPEHFFTVYGSGYRFEFDDDISQVAIGLSVTRFRPSDTAELIDELRSAPGVYTLVGPGGMGKTTLARWAYQHWPASRRASCNLTRCRSEFDIIEALSYTLGLRSPAGASASGLKADVAEGLRRVGGLIWLDGAETVLDVLPNLMRRWVEVGDGLRFMLTSRAPLEITGERVRRLAPLTPASAREFFLAKAEAAGASAEALGASQAEVKQVLSRLDGVPLALELIASYCGSLSLPDVLQEVTSPSMVTLEGPRDLPARQRTMWATHDWSWRLLSAYERRVWMLCAHVAGSVDEELLAAVVEPEEVAGLGEALTTLAKRSLVEPEEDAPPGGSGYGLLETAREYLRGRLGESGVAEEVEQRSRVAIIEKARLVVSGELPIESFPPLKRQRVIRWIRAGVEASLADGDPAVVPLALAHDRLIARAAAPAVRLSWIDRVMGAGDTGPLNQAALLRARGECLARSGGFDDARIAFSEALAIAEREGAAPLVVWLHSNIGLCAWASGNAHQAAEHLAKARAIDMNAADVSTSLPYLNLALLHLDYGLLDSAERFLREAQDKIGEEAGGFTGVLTLIAGRLHRDRGEMEEATRCFNRALGEFERSGDRRVWQAVGEIALHDIQLGRVDEGFARLNECIAAGLKFDAPGPRAQFLYFRALHHFGSGDLSRSLTDAEEAVEVLERIHSSRRKPYLLALIAVISAHSGMTTEADEAMNAARSLLLPEMGRRLRPFLRAASLAVYPEVGSEGRNEGEFALNTDESPSAELRLFWEGICRLGG